jgi:hypothetical protein
MRETEIESSRAKRAEHARPTFLVPGVGKSGTSSLYEYLKQHPEIFMTPKKEPGFFNWDGRAFDQRGPVDEKLYLAAVRDFDAYRALYSGRATERVAGEATPNYLYNDHAPQRIHARYPDLRFVVMLRHPVERLFSHYLHMRRMGDEPLSLEDALGAEAKRRANGWGPSYHYLAQGHYAAQLGRWLARFDRARFHFVLYDDFERDSQAVMRGVYAFLGVDADFEPDTGVVHNAHYAPKSERLHELVMGNGSAKQLAKLILPSRVRRSASAWIRRKNAQAKPTLAPTLHDALLDAYLDDITRLEAIIARDLSAWKRSR